MRRRTAAIFAALILDLALGDPPNAWHPVAWGGRLTGWLADRGPASGPRRQFVYGVGIVAVASLSSLGPAWASRRVGGVTGFLLEVLLLKSTFSLRGLLDAGDQVQRDLERGNLEAARRDVRSLVSRDTTDLSADQIAAAAVESVAENLTDSVIAPLLAYRLFGLPGAAVYRAVNTCDAMIGYHGRYEYLGKAAARLDDGFNLIPARAAALLLAGVAPFVGGSAVQAFRIMWRDHGLTESPNAGWTMSAAAGALGVQLEKSGHYRLGDPVRAVEAATIGQSSWLVTAAVGMGAAILLVADAPG